MACLLFSFSVPSKTKYLLIYLFSYLARFVGLREVDREAMPADFPLSWHCQRVKTILGASSARDGVDEKEGRSRHGWMPSPGDDAGALR